MMLPTSNLTLDSLSQVRMGRPSYRGGTPDGDNAIMSELAVENTPDVAEPAHKAARGQVIYITERGERVAAIVPAAVAAELERLSADELDELAAVADQTGHGELSRLLERPGRPRRSAGIPGRRWPRHPARAGQGRSRPVTGDLQHPVAAASPQALPRPRQASAETRQ